MLQRLFGGRDDDGAHDAAGEAGGGRGDGVEDRVLAGCARVDRDGGRGRAVEQDDDAEIEVALWRDDARAEVVVGVAEVDGAGWRCR